MASLCRAGLGPRRVSGNVSRAARARALAETALRLLFPSSRKAADLEPLPRFRSGGALVDVADRTALYEAMEGR